MGDGNRWAKSYGGEERLRRNLVSYRCGDLTIPILDWLTPRLFDSTTSFARLRYPIRDWARKHIATQNPNLPSWAVDYLVSDTSQLPIKPLPGRVWTRIHSHGELDMDIPFQPLGGPVQHVKLKGHLSGPVSQPTVQVGLYSWKGKTPVEIDHWEGKIKSIGEKCFIESPWPGTLPGQTPGGTPLKHQFPSGYPWSVGMTSSSFKPLRLFDADSRARLGLSNVPFGGFGGSFSTVPSLSRSGSGFLSSLWDSGSSFRPPASSSSFKPIRLFDTDSRARLGLSDLTFGGSGGSFSAIPSLSRSGGGFLSNLWNASSSFSSASAGPPSIRLSTSPTLSFNPPAWQGMGSLSGGPSLSSFARGL